MREMTAFAGRPGAFAGGPRSVASGTQRPRCSRMRRTTPGSSIQARFSRIGPLFTLRHFGHSSGSASYSFRMRRAQGKGGAPSPPSGFGARGERTHRLRLCRGLRRQILHLQRSCPPAARSIRIPPNVANEVLVAIGDLAAQQLEPLGAGQVSPDQFEKAKETLIYSSALITCSLPARWPICSWCAGICSELKGLSSSRKRKAAAKRADRDRKSPRSEGKLRSRRSVRICELQHRQLFRRSLDQA